MKPLDDKRDDLLPEENERQQKKLVTLLRKAYQAHPDLSQEEHEQILARVRAQLLQTEQTLSPDGEAPLHPVGSTNSSSSNHTSVFPQPRRGRGFREGINALAAVLVVGVLISGSLLFFTHLSSQPHSGLRSPFVGPGKTVTVVSSADGLEMSMGLTSGPYFLSEKLAMDISLTNHTNATEYVGLPFTADHCGDWPGITVTGGNKPDYTIPIATDHSCPFSSETTPLKPGQTLTVHKYMPLTSSGKQILTAETAFYSGSSQGPGPYPSRVSSPLEKHWPTIQISVSPTIPSDRKLSFRREGSQVVVNAPTGTPSHLVYLYGVGCNDSNNNGESTISGNYGWEPISTNRVNEAGCPGKNVHWDFAFGAPGYGVLTGSYPSS
jgi:hypothetical protein